MPPLQKCVVIMSFSAEEDLNRAYQEGIKEAVEGVGIECARVDEIPGAGLIYSQIISNIKKAFFLVADLTGERPNCCYELGFAYALGRQQHVIIVARHGEEIHFDLRGYRPSSILRQMTFASNFRVRRVMDAYDRTEHTRR